MYIIILMFSTLGLALMKFVFFSHKGKIACANVLSDLYAMGVFECDNMLMLLGVSENFTYSQRQVVTPMMIKGFTGWTISPHCLVSLLRNLCVTLMHIKIKQYICIHRSLC